MLITNHTHANSQSVGMRTRQDLPVQEEDAEQVFCEAGGFAGGERRVASVYRELCNSLAL